MANGREKLPFRTKFLFGLADFYGGGSMNIVNFFYAIFLTDVVRISPWWASAIVLVSKVWDAVIDPFLGVVTDNTRTRWGRRRPYFLAGVPLVFLAFVLLWYPIAVPSEAVRVAFVALAYILFNTVSSLASVPYQSMAGEITLDYDERSSITGMRMVFSMGATFVCALLPRQIIDAFPDIRQGYIAMSVVFGLLFGLSWLAAFFSTKENPEFMRQPRQSWREAFPNIWRALSVRTYRKLVLMYVTMFTAMDVISMIFAYFMTYRMGREGEISTVLASLVAAQILFIPLVLFLSRRMDKVKAYIAGCAGWVVCGLASLLIGPDSPSFTVYLLAVCLGACTCFPVISVHALFGDTTDVGELYFHSRVEGSFSGVQTFLRSVASAAANGIALALLGAAGYVKPLVEKVGAATTNVAQPQPEAVVLTIRLILSLTPLLLLTVGIVVALGWKLTPAVQRELVRYLDARRAGRPLEDDEEKRKGWLKIL